MKTQTRVKLNKTSDSDQSTSITLTVTFPRDDPRADQIFAAFGTLIGTVLTQPERDEFLKQLNREHAHLTNQARS